MARRRKFRLPKLHLGIPLQTRLLFRSLSNLAPVGPAKAAKLANPPGRTSEITDFGTNPGKLKMFVYAPEKPVRPSSPLIVVLHGCGQHAETFAANAGWVALANHFRLPLLLPEQIARNNASRCFNWYSPADARRGCGEAMSVRQMVRAAIKRFSSDPRQVFVVGLSAGGALTGALLAAYPAVFNAGAVVAGMPVGAASNAASALIRMHRADAFSSRETLISAVTRQQPVGKRPRKWPRISIWHGERDRHIDPANGTALAAQWSGVHGFAETPSADEVAASGIRRRSWGTPKRTMVEWWTLPEMGHGFPVDASIPGAGNSAFGVIDAGISAAYHIARFWGLQI